MSGTLKRRDLMKKSTLFAMGMYGSGRSYAQDEDPFPTMRIEYKSPAEYSPLLYIEKVKNGIKPSLEFTAATERDAFAWQKQARARLWEVLGESHTPSRNAHNARILEQPQDVGGYTREKWVLDVEPGRSMPFYVLRPLKKRPVYRTAVCLHGHGNGVKDIIGMPVDDEAAELIGILSEDYAVQTVKRGWCAVAPELWSFGERLDFVEGAREGFDGGCEKPHLNAIELGKCSIGIRAKDIVTLIDWISTRNEFDMDNLACMGLSGGGMMTMYTSALDERIRRVLIAGYLSEMKGSILGIRHCGCNYVPNLAKWMDFPDITALIAPRKLVAVSGRRDAIFPIDSFRAAADKVKGAYAVFGKPDSFIVREHPGFHSFDPAAVDDLFA